MLCRFCLSPESNGDFLNIFSEAPATQARMISIIRQHLGIKLNAKEHNTTLICGPCWRILRDFHNFFLMVEESQRNLSETTQTAETPADAMFVVKEEALLEPSSSNNLRENTALIDPLCEMEEIEDDSFEAEYTEEDNSPKYENYLPADQNSSEHEDLGIHFMNVQSSAKQQQKNKPKSSQKPKSGGKQYIRKINRQHGKPYISSKGIPQLEKKMKPSCTPNCSYSCSQNFNEDERQNIFQKFWQLDDREKMLYYSKFVLKTGVKRRRTGSTYKKNSSFLYHFEKDNGPVQVCNVFFLNTLSISEKRIYYHFKNFYNIDPQIVRKTSKKKIEN